jgi:hypothetical protein
MNGTPDLEAIRQEHETWLNELEGLAVQAIAKNNWDAFYAHVVDFQNEHDLHGETGIAIFKNLTVRFSKLEASTKSLSGSGADSLPTTEALRIVRNKTHHVTTARINAETTGVDGVSEPAGDNTAHL